MRDKPVGASLKILPLLLTDEMHVNVIFRKTGLTFKQEVTDAIELLRKGGLITKTLKRGYKQILLVRLTPLGRELAELIVALEHYHSSYAELISAINENFDIPKETDKTILNGKLRHRRWTDQEISLYEKFYDCNNYLKSIFPRKFIQSLFHRYALILSKFTPDEIAKTIVNRVIMEPVPDMLLLIIERVAQEPPIKDSHGEINYYDSERSNFFSDMFRSPELAMILDFLIQYFDLLNNRFVREQTKRVLASIFSIIKPSQDVVEIYHKVLLGTIRDVKEGTPLLDQPIREYKKQVLQLYEEVIAKANLA